MLIIREHPAWPVLCRHTVRQRWTFLMEGTKIRKGPTETRFSSTNGVSMWCLMVDMMSLKSMAEMTPFFSLSFWANAWRACSSCNSWAINVTWCRKAEWKHRPINGNAWNPALAEGAARKQGGVPAGTGWTRGSWGVSYSLAQSANGWTRSPIWRGCGDALWSGWRCHAHFLQHKRKISTVKDENYRNVDAQMIAITGSFVWWSTEKKKSSAAKNCTWMVM